MTPEEKLLWYGFLNKLPLTVKRQRVIGKYIVDFCITKAKLVIELDGIQHEEDSHYEADKIRDEYMNSLGITVLRYSNADIHNHFYEICQDIVNHIPELKNSGIID